MLPQKWLLAGLAALFLGGCGASDDGQASSGSPATQPGSAVAVAPAASAKPSFDCAKASSEVENTVCADAQLAALDNETTRLFNLAVSGPHMDKRRLDELRAFQRGWIKGRNECWKAQDGRDCIVQEYGTRIAQLRQGYFDARSADSAGISNGPVALACKGLDFGISATFIQTDPPLANLQWLDHAITLSLSPSGSGAKYEGTSFEGKYTLWTKGDDALLTMPGEPEIECRIEEIG